MISKTSTTNKEILKNYDVLFVKIISAVINKYCFTSFVGITRLEIVSVSINTKKSILIPVSFLHLLTHGTNV